MNTAVEGTASVALTVLSVVVLIALYVWSGLALSAMFRKMGEDAWRGWVPLLNTATVLKWGGFSPWLVLLVLFPPTGIVVAILLIVSAHRINPGFGYGGGMTVVAAFLFLVWATILGFGPAPWRGSRPGGPRATGQTPVAAGVGSTADAPPDALPWIAVPPPPHQAPPAPWSPPAASSAQAAPAAEPATDPIAAWAPPAPPAPPVPQAPPATPAATEAETASTPGVPGPDRDDEIDEVSAVSPSPFPPSTAASSRPFMSPPVGGADDERPERRAGRGAAGAPITRLPASPRSVPIPDNDVFPELTGEVSAVVGSPAAGAPISASRSVPAQQEDGTTGDPDGDAPDGAAGDQTVIVRRKRVVWEIVPPVGEPIALRADVAIVGRQPAADPAFPGAQLVAVTDPTRTVSKTHARLERRGDAWHITDLGSTNGVLLPSLLGTDIEVEPGTDAEVSERFLLGDAALRLQHRPG